MDLPDPRIFRARLFQRFCKIQGIFCCRQKWQREIPVPQGQFQHMRRFLRREIFLPLQDGYNDLKAFSRQLRMSVRTQSRWCLGQTAEQNGFRQIQVFRRSAEIIPCRSFDPVDLTAIRQHIEILFKDLILFEKPFIIKSFCCLNKFVFQGAALCFRFQHLDQLHRDGGGAGDDPAVGEQLSDRPENGNVIHAVMLIKTVILRREHGTDQMFRQIGKFYRKTIAVIIPRNTVDRLTGSVVKDGSGRNPLIYIPFHRTAIGHDAVSQQQQQKNCGTCRREQIPQKNMFELIQ